MSTHTDDAAGIDLTVIYPRFHHEAIEERYAAAHSRLLIRREVPAAEWLFYDDDEPVDLVARGSRTRWCLVVTDPLLVISADLVVRLYAAAASSTDAIAAVPVSNEAVNDAQRVAPPEAYLTLRQFGQVAEKVASPAASSATSIDWKGDPGIYLTLVSYLETQRRRARAALDGSRVAIARNAYVHRWAQMRGRLRTDLLERVPSDATSVLEFGCGEGFLGEALKKRQRCRVVGIELDREAAAAARRRIDDVYVGDVRELIGIINERFEWIIGGDILEHLDDPWSFLQQLRNVSALGGALLLSIPNIANWAIIADLLRGRFDYSYTAITCAGHLRFFTRATIEDALEITGWSIESIEPQPPIVSPEFADLEQRLTTAGITYSRDEIITTGYYVIARNDID